MNVLQHIIKTAIYTYRITHTFNCTPVQGATLFLVKTPLLPASLLSNSRRRKNKLSVGERDGLKGILCEICHTDKNRFTQVFVIDQQENCQT